MNFRHSVGAIGLLALVKIAGVAHAADAPLPDSLVAAPPAATRLAADSVAVPLDLSMGQPVVAVMIDERGPYRMFLDTAAGVTVLDDSLARELGLASRGSMRLGDPADPRAIEANIVRIDSLRIGGAVFAGVLAASWDRSQLRRGTDPPRGVVGLPVFHDLLETIDFPAATLRLAHGRLDAATAGILAYRSVGGTPVVPIDVAGASMEAHLDTGSPGFLSVPEKDSSRVRFAEPLRIVGRGRTVNSVVTFRGAPLDGAVRVGGAAFDRPLVVLNDRLPTAILGSRALRDCIVTLDAANARMSVVRTRVSLPTRHGARPPTRPAGRGDGNASARRRRSAPAAGAAANAEQQGGDRSAVTETADPVRGIGGDPRNACGEPQGQRAGNEREHACGHERPGTQLAKSHRSHSFSWCGGTRA